MDANRETQKATRGGSRTKVLIPDTEKVIENPLPLHLIVESWSGQNKMICIQNLKYSF
jgi:hypothetical protein